MKYKITRHRLEVSVNEFKIDSPGDEWIFEGMVSSEFYVFVMWRSGAKPGAVQDPKRVGR